MDGMEGMDGAEMAGHRRKNERPLTEDGTPEDSGETMHVPSGFLQGTRFKEGDELVLKVVSVDEEGIEVAYAPKGEGSGGDGSGSPDAELDQLDRNTNY